MAAQSMEMTHDTSGQEVTPEIRKAWREAHVRPLWESTTAHKSDKDGEPAHIWKWDVIKPLITETIKIQSPAAVERRVLSLINPKPITASGEGTTVNISAAIQILMPGERARPHRHTMNALRFVLEGEGASTIVDGKDCPMAEGDLVITPAWTWHEHVHRGSGPIVWLDVLDVPLHHYLDTGRFEPGPVHDVPETAADAAFASPNFVAEAAYGNQPYSPVFRYPRKDALAAVASAPLAKDRTRRVRYANPLTGGSSMALLDSYFIEIDAGASSLPFRTTANSVCAVVEGEGTSRIGGSTIEWGPKDVFTLPHGNWIEHRAKAKIARLVQVTDREVLRRLDLLVEDYGNRPA